MAVAIDPAEFGVDGRTSLVPTLARVIAVKAQIKALKEELEKLEQPLKIELTNNPEPIVDGEHGIVAMFKERSTPADFDLIAMAQATEAGLLIQAAAQGRLTVRTTQLRGMKGRSAAADAILRYQMPGGVQQALIVEEV